MAHLQLRLKHGNVLKKLQNKQRKLCMKALNGIVILCQSQLP